MVQDSEKIQKGCPGTNLVVDRERGKAYCALAHEGTGYSLGRGWKSGEGYAGIGRKAWTSIDVAKTKVNRKDPKWKRQLDNRDVLLRALGFSLKGHKAIKQWIDKTFRAPEREAKKRKTAIVPYIPPPPMICKEV